MTTCDAPRHGARHAYGPNRCNCPVAQRRRAWRSHCPPITGRASNLRGPRRGLDEAAVERAVNGDQSLRLTAEERREAVARLTRRGWSAARIAVHLGCTPRTVQRARRRTRHRARQAA